MAWFEPYDGGESQALEQEQSYFYSWSPPKVVETKESDSKEGSPKHAPSSPWSPLTNSYEVARSKASRSSRRGTPKNEDRPSPSKTRSTPGPPSNSGTEIAKAVRLRTLQRETSSQDANEARRSPSVRNSIAKNYFSLEATEKPLSYQSLSEMQGLCTSPQMGTSPEEKCSPTAIIRSTAPEDVADIIKNDGASRSSISSSRPSIISVAQKLRRSFLRTNSDDGNGAEKAIKSSSSKPGTESRDDTKQLVQEARQCGPWKREKSSGFFDKRLLQNLRAKNAANAEPEGSFPLESSSTSIQDPYKEKYEGQEASLVQSPVGDEHQDRHFMNKIEQGPALQTSDNMLSKALVPKKIYGRLRRQLASKNRPEEIQSQEYDAPVKRNASNPSTTSGTRNLLEQTTSALLHGFTKKRRGLTPPNGSSSPSSTGAVRTPKSQGRFSRFSTSSISSSVLSFRNSKPINSTPDSDEQYLGADNRKYLRVELARTNSPCYLPSEAQKISTPAGPPVGQRPRSPQPGYFTRRTDQGSPSMSQTTPEIKSHVAADRTQGLHEREWFRMTLGSAKEANSIGFILDIPEHLPSSPLCPRHPKNKLKGKGVCVYHGRNRTDSDSDEAATSPDLWR